VKLATLGLIAVALIASPCAAQKVYVDYDAYADFSTYKTFAWVDTNTTSLKLDFPEVDSMIKNRRFRVSCGNGIRLRYCA
jgi:hypothetical protein